MKMLSVLALCLLVSACGKNPLSEKVDRLEARVEELEAGHGEERQALLGRVDQIPVTEQNAGDLADLRSKLAQTGITQADLAAVRARLDALERLAPDWSSVAGNASRAVYAVLHGVWLEDGDAEFTFVGTAFAVSGKALVTNAHVVDYLFGLQDKVNAFNQKYGTSLTNDVLVVQNGTTALREASTFFFIELAYRHRQWTGEIGSPDVGSLVVRAGTLNRSLAVLSAVDALSLRVGQPLATMGFPGELQGGELNNFFPIATFKLGALSALRPPHSGRSYTARDTYIVQHSLDLSGGTSGSPILNTAGRVVAVNNAGIEALVLSIGGQPARIPQTALGFGIRADKIRELLGEMGVSAKPVAMLPGTAPNLDGRDVPSREIHQVTEDLGERLVKRLAER